MKTTKIYVLIFLSIMINFLDAQWQPDVRLTNNTAASHTSTLRQNISSNGDYIHVVWTDNRNGLDEIYYKRSTNRGLTWGSDIRLTDAPGNSKSPTVAVFGSIVHIVWETDRDGGSNWEIYYKRSTNNGLNWSSDTRLTNNTSSQYKASISAGSYIHVVWVDHRHGDAEIYYKRSTDQGVNWGADTRLTNYPLDSKYPVIAVWGSVVHVVFDDERNGVGYPEIYYKRSTNNGMNWGSDARLTNNSGESRYPFVSVSGSEAHVVWQDNRDGNWEIYYQRSLDNGINWGTDYRLTNNTFSSSFASVCLSGSFVHTVWGDNRSGNKEIYYKVSTNHGSVWSPDYRLTTAVGDKDIPSIDISGPVVNVLWDDNRDGNFEIYYKRNPTGNPVSINNINSEIPNDFSLSQNYPNPFNPVTNINFSIPKSGIVKLVVSDLSGKEIAVLVNNALAAGTYTVDFDASDFASGVYVYKLTSGDFTGAKKMILVK
jgi:hypothetical protein